MGSIVRFEVEGGEGGLLRWKCKHGRGEERVIRKMARRHKKSKCDQTEGKLTTTTAMPPDKGRGS